MTNNPGNPVVWFEIYVADMARAKAFYETVLGIALQPLGNPAPDQMTMELMAFPGGPGSYGACGALVRMAGVPQGFSGTLVYFACKDCALEASRVTAAGGSIEKPKFAIGPHGFIALCRDSEGNMFGLHSMA